MESNGKYRIGGKGYVTIEACEYGFVRRLFLEVVNHGVATGKVRCHNHHEVKGTVADFIARGKAYAISTYGIEATDDDVMTELFLELI